MFLVVLSLLSASSPAHASDSGPLGFVIAFSHVGSAVLVAAPGLALGATHPRPIGGQVDAQILGMQLAPGLGWHSRVSMGGYGERRLGWEGRSDFVAEDGSWRQDIGGLLLLRMTPTGSPVSAELLLGAHIQPQMFWSEGFDPLFQDVRWDVIGGPALGARVAWRPIDLLQFSGQGLARPLSGGELGGRVQILPRRKDPIMTQASIDVGYTWTSEFDAHRVFVGFTVRE